MSEYESLQQDIAGVAESLAHYANAVRRALDSHGDEIQRLWDDRAELRDDLHALANRVETLTRARLTEPAEVAEAMVRKRGRTLRTCECGVPVVVHHDPQPSPIRNAADGTPHTCDADAANVRRMAKEYGRDA